MKLKTIASIIILLVCSHIASGQAKLGTLTIEKIMRDPKWIGSSPSSPRWSVDGRTLYFSWNPDKAADDSLYYITIDSIQPKKLSPEARKKLVTAGSVEYNRDYSFYVYSRDGDIFFVDTRKNIEKRVTQTIDAESQPKFSFSDKAIVYLRSQNLYAWDLSTGETKQLTNIRSASDANKSKKAVASQQDEWLKNDQLQFFEVLRERKAKKDITDSLNKLDREPEMKQISLDDQVLQGLDISPDGRFVYYRLFKPASGNKTTIVPDYVTESGYTTPIPTRTKVGTEAGKSNYHIYDRKLDTIYKLVADSLPAMLTPPAFLADYKGAIEAWKKNNKTREISISSPDWSPAGSFALFDIRSMDNKDRWLASWDTAAKVLKLISHQHDDAWIGGPGIYGSRGWLSESSYWFQSEETGFSHIYSFDLRSGEKKALTSGRFEVLRAELSRDRKTFYLTTNENDPTQQHVYSMKLSDLIRRKISWPGASNQFVLSPDEKHFAILNSYSNIPWELHIQQNKPGGKPRAITGKGRSEEFRSYQWRIPEIIKIPARDSAKIYARLYRPANPHTNRPAVIFVHGAGYLQNAHQWWSNYFREYMFHNMLADQGYTVLDIDYRGSAGYGRDWRTGIYRHMGGKDLDDHEDAAKYLIDSFNINPSAIGIYGGSYGGFITLMAMFTKPNLFAAGAALRPVTDWANYNHTYTSNILNEPFDDSIAYRRSSPIYFAEGLKGHLLICHGMVDVNVHYQDAVKLAQRLIELGKDNWELASYPMENHGFTEPSSWTDEYKRIYKLFERVLKNENR